MNTFLGVLAFLVFLLVFLYYVPLGLYFISKTNGLNLSLLQLLLMRFRKVPPAVIVNQLIKAKNEGIELDCDVLEAYYLAYGNVNDLVEALIYAREKGVEINHIHLMRAGLNQKDLKSLIDLLIENRKFYGNDYSFENLI